MSDPCRCCGRPWSACGPSAEPRRDTSREFTCAECNGAHGAVSAQADREHITLWQQHATSQAGQYNAELARLNNRIGDLDRELEDRPEKRVEVRIGEDTIQAANDEARRAFRSRQNAWQALCEIRLLHRDEGNGQCRCTEKLDRCREAEIVDRYPGLAEWEQS